MRILLADDHEVLRRGVKHLLEAQPDWRVCGEATDGREAVALAEQLKPDVAIVDLTMPGLNGLEATRQIRSASPATEVLVFTVHDSEQFAREALAAGARGYVLKADTARQLVLAVESLSRGKPFVTPRLARARLNGCAPPRPRFGGEATLTPREREITQLLAEGKSNQSIAIILGISVKTVETHRGNIMQKLGLESIVELVHYAVRNQMVAP